MRAQQRLILRFILISLAVATMAVARPASKGKAPDPTLPSVDFSVILSQDTVNRGKSALVNVLIANKSNIYLTRIRVRCLDPDFPVSSQTGAMAPFGSTAASFDLKPRENVDFGSHRLAFLMEYQWNGAGKTFQSAQTATVTLTVQRPFEEEAKGLPGGTGALLYLLLPVMPAFLAFEFANSIRKGEGFRIPTFSADYVLPAFLLGLGISFLVLLVAKQNIDFAYANPKAFGAMLLVSMAVGAFIPVVLWFIDVIHWSIYGFRDTDTGVQYLIKTLRLDPKGLFPWKTGTAEGQQWQGLALKQPNGKLALGARVQVSPTDALTADQVRAVFQGDTLINARQMERWLRQGAVTVAYRARIQRAGAALDQHVITTGLDGFTPTTSQTLRLIEVVG